MAVGIAASIAKDDFSNAMRSSLKKSMSNYTINEVDRKAWDTIQQKVCTVMLLILPILIYQYFFILFINSIIITIFL